jgi:hypothetical protein
MLSASKTCFSNATALLLVVVLLLEDDRYYYEEGVAPLPPYVLSDHLAQVETLPPYTHTRTPQTEAQKYS